MNRGLSKCFWHSAFVWGCIICSDRLWSVWKLSQNQWCECLLLRVGHLYSVVNVFAPEKVARKCLGMSVGVFLHTAQRAAMVPAGVELNVAAWLKQVVVCRLWDWSRAEQAVVTHCFSCLYFFHTHTVHTHTLLDTRFYLSLTSPRGLWADVLTLNNTIRNLLLPQDIGVTTHSPSLLLCLANFLTLFHTRIHTRTHRFAQLFLLGHCIDSLCTT